jgi:hypothetical protein
LDRSTSIGWDKLNVSAQTHQKNPFSQTHISQTIRQPQYKVLCTAFFQESAFPHSSTLAIPKSL